MNVQVSGTEKPSDRKKKMFLSFQSKLKCSFELTTGNEMKAIQGDDFVFFKQCNKQHGWMN